MTQQLSFRMWVSGRLVKGRDGTDVRAIREEHRGPVEKIEKRRGGRGHGRREIRQEKKRGGRGERRELKDRELRNSNSEYLNPKDESR